MVVKMLSGQRFPRQPLASNTIAAGVDALSIKISHNIRKASPAVPCLRHCGRFDVSWDNEGRRIISRPVLDKGKHCRVLYCMGRSDRNARWFRYDHHPK
jgi:hypothetical protein